MSEDRYRNIREMPFDVLAGILDFDISKFKRRKGGTEWAGPCPVHRPKKNSTAFSYSSDGKFACFSCSAKRRGAIDLAMQVRGCGFQAAVELLEPYASGGGAGTGWTRHRESPRQAPAQEPQSTSETPPFKSTYAKHFKPHEWPEKRGITAAALERFGSGVYDNPSRKSSYNGSLMLRIRRWSDSEPVGYLSRNIGEVTPEKSKYRFAEGFQKSLELFGCCELREDRKVPVRIVYLVESPLCVLKFWQMGIPAVSPFGWSCSKRQAEIIGQLAKGVVLLLDRDKEEQAGPVVHLLAKRAGAKVRACRKVSQTRNT